MPTASIVIPVFNKWDLTRNCLKAIAANTPAGVYEVIVVDNASSDDTPGEVPNLGKTLFGENFQYIRNDQNRNFSGASNQGAEAARGEFVVFLNNDTEVQPLWLEKLLDDFTAYPQILGTGPLLLYPDETPLGKLVQHLGVTISPSYRVGHLYAGVPAASPLARKRRFFQVITGACMVMRKKVFMEAGKFDERFINGFEDVDLCARITAKGGMFTVNPEAEVIHHESQTPGRHDNDVHNSELINKNSLPLLHPDKHLYAKADGMEFGFDEWLNYRFKLPEERLTKLAKLAGGASAEQLQTLLLAWPLWKDGWRKLLDLYTQKPGELQIAKIFLKLWEDPDTAFSAWEIGSRYGDRDFTGFAQRVFRDYAAPPGSFLAAAQSALDWNEKLGFTDFAEQLKIWIANYSGFINGAYKDFQKLFRIYAQKKGLPPESDTPEPGPSLVGGSLIPDEYVKLYPEVGYMGFDPYCHYVLGGMQEGRKGHFSRIDYSGLTPERIENWRQAPDAGVVVCTSICGDYDRLLPPAYLNDGWRYICFTDQPREDWGIWKLREIPYKGDDLTRRSRWAKLNLPLLFPTAKRIIWQDANIVIASDLSPYIDKGEMAMVPHTNRNCIYQEAKVVDHLRKDTKAKIYGQTAKYRADGMPENFGMWENNLFVIDPSSPRIKQIFAQWWQEYEKYCRRDQISLPYVFYKNKFRPELLFPDNKNARSWPGVHFLTHGETKWIVSPVLKKY